MQVVGTPDPEYPHIDHLWLLVGGGDHHDDSQAFYIGADRDIKGGDIATCELDHLLERLQNDEVEVDAQDARQSFLDHRNRRNQA